jgi:predicted HAD superfamily phosphohydrolase
MKLANLFDDADRGRQKLKPSKPQLKVSVKWKTLYAGDGITDVEAFRLVRQRRFDRFFNGNEYAIRNAEIAVKRKQHRSAIIFDLFSKLGKRKQYGAGKLESLKPSNKIQ